jgi:predicted Holliday junction resolvase-like endonuclease
MENAYPFFFILAVAIFILIGYIANLRADLRSYQKELNAKRRELEELSKELGLSKKRRH